jgi:hypothetical protein
VVPSSGGQLDRILQFLDSAPPDPAPPAWLLTAPPDEYERALNHLYERVRVAMLPIEESKGSGTTAGAVRPGDSRAASTRRERQRLVAAMPNVVTEVERLQVQIRWLERLRRSASPTRLDRIRHWVTTFGREPR